MGTIGLTHQTRVLDKGYVEYRGHTGSDRDVDVAARVSHYNRAFEKEEAKRKPEERTRLLRFLRRKRHTTPYERPKLVVRLYAPVFVARQLFRHRTGTFQEQSLRYEISGGDFYIPDASRVSKRPPNVKQGSGAAMDPAKAEEIRNLILAHSEAGQRLYARLVTREEDGGEFELAPELGRMVLPQNLYVLWEMDFNLHNWFHLLGLRMKPDAQWETRQYAEAIAAYIKAFFPECYRAFVDYQLEARTMSRMEVSILRRILLSEGIAANLPNLLQTYGGGELSEMSESERKDFIALLAPMGGT